MHSCGQCSEFDASCGSCEACVCHHQPSVSWQAEQQRGKRGKRGKRGHTGHPGASGPGSIIPFASNVPLEATFNAVNPTLGVLGFGFGGSVQEVQLADLGASGFSYVPFSIPRGGIVTAMDARVTLTPRAGGTLPNENLVVQVELREQQPGENDNFTTVRASVQIPFAPPFPAISRPVNSGAVNMFVPVSRGTRLLVSVKVTGSTQTPGLVGVFTSAGLNIV